MINNLRKSVSAGIMIGIGATVYLLCENKIVGAILFSVGLFTICSLKLNLFTGKIGYVIEYKNYLDCLVTWVGNFLGCLLVTFSIRIANPETVKLSAKIVENKLTQSYLSIIILGMFCGAIMYIAINNYQNNTDFGKQIGIILFVTTFIICGFEHSIADMCYFLFSVNSLNEILVALQYIFIVSIANSIGSILFRILSKTQ